MPLDHTGIYVTDFEAAKAFYLAALEPLGYKIIFEMPHVVGMGADGVADWWIAPAGDHHPVTPDGHYAFKAASREVVDKFHAAALYVSIVRWVQAAHFRDSRKAGATDNGAPGVRKYAPTYYAAYVKDVHGNNIEVVHQ